MTFVSGVPSCDGFIVGNMLTVLVWIFEISLLIWLLAEVVMQVVQWRQGGRAQRTEWRSLGMLVVAFAIGNVLGALARDNVRALDLHIPWKVLFFVAIPVLWFGVGFRLWSIRTLGKFFRGVVHVQENHEVVRDGPYRVLRHPSYTGALIAILGVALTFNNILAIVVFVGCGFVGIYYRIVVEERVLIEGLGKAYTDYVTTTKRLIPGVW